MGAGGDWTEARIRDSEGGSEEWTRPGETGLSLEGDTARPTDWPEAQGASDELPSTRREQIEWREGLAGGQAARREKGTREARRLGEDPRQEAVAWGPARYLEVQAGWQRPKRAGCERHVDGRARTSDLH